MVLVYDDDILCTHKDKLVVIDSLTSIYIMKQGIMGPPYHYLGSNIDKVQTQEGKDLWATHRGDYCEAVIANMEKTLTDDGKSYRIMGMVGVHIRQVSTQRLTPLLIWV